MFLEAKSKVELANRGLLVFNNAKPTTPEGNYIIAQMLVLISM